MRYTSTNAVLKIELEAMSKDELIEQLLTTNRLIAAYRDQIFAFKKLVHILKRSKCN